MTQKKPFKPTVTRIELEPEQAVLACACYNSQNYWDPYTAYPVSSDTLVCRGKNSAYVTKNLSGGLGSS